MANCSKAAFHSKHCRTPGCQICTQLTLGCWSLTQTLMALCRRGMCCLFIIDLQPPTAFLVAFFPFILTLPPTHNNLSGFKSDNLFCIQRHKIVSETLKLLNIYLYKVWRIQVPYRFLCLCVVSVFSAYAKASHCLVADRPWFGFLAPAKNMLTC